MTNRRFQPMSCFMLHSRLDASKFQAKTAWTLVTRRPRAANERFATVPNLNCRLNYDTQARVRACAHSRLSRAHTRAARKTSGAFAIGLCRSRRKSPHGWTPEWRQCLCPVCSFCRCRRRSLPSQRVGVVRCEKIRWQPTRVPKIAMNCKKRYLTNNRSYQIKD